MNMKLLFSVAVALCKNSELGKVSTVVSNEEPSMEKKLSQNMLKYTNDFRVRNNMEALVENEALVAVAKRQVKYMCEIEALTHRSRDDKSLKTRLKKEDFFGVNIGENIAKQQGNDYEEVAKMWIKSEEHKKNILGDFTFTGVSTCRDSQYNRYWIQVFGKGISNKQLPSYQDYRMLNRYIDDGYSPQMENDKYVILLKPTDSEQDGERDIGGGNIKSSGNDEPNKLKKTTSALDVSDRKKKDFGYGIIDQSQPECTDSRHCQPGEMIRPQIFDMDNGYPVKNTKGPMKELRRDISNEHMVNNTGSITPNIPTFQLPPSIALSETPGTIRMETVGPISSVLPKLSTDNKVSTNGNIVDEVKKLIPKMLKDFKDEIISEIKNTPKDKTSIEESKKPPTNPTKSIDTSNNSPSYSINLSRSQIQPKNQKTSSQSTKAEKISSNTYKHTSTPTSVDNSSIMNTATDEVPNRTISGRSQYHELNHVPNTNKGELIKKPPSERVSKTKKIKPSQNDLNISKSDIKNIVKEVLAENDFKLKMMGENPSEKTKSPKDKANSVEIGKPYSYK